MLFTCSASAGLQLVRVVVLLLVVVVVVRILCQLPHNSLNRRPTDLTIRVTLVTILKIIGVLRKSLFDSRPFEAARLI